MKYTIKKGDTLSAIATKHGVTVNAIKNANVIIKDVNKINVGWVIEIPTTASVNYDDIGKCFVECINDIKNLSSYKKLISMF